MRSNQIKNSFVFWNMIKIILITQTLFSQYLINRIIDTDVFILNEPGYHYFRIPSIIVTNNHVLLAFAEGRQNTESDGDEEENDIVLKRSFNNGYSWGDLIVVAEAGANSLNNPQAILIPSNNRIILMYQMYPVGLTTSTVSSGYNPDSTCTSYVQYSDDEGETWSSPVDITQQVKTSEDINFVFSGPGIGIQLRRGNKSGRIIMPFTQGPLSDMKVYSVYSDDGGESWSHGSVAENSEMISGNEVQLVELSNGTIYLNSRSGIDGENFRNISYSFDSGESWIPLEVDTTLIDPKCMGSLIRYDDILDNGFSRLYFCNPASQVDRINGTLYQSLNDAYSWDNQWIIEPGYFGYSSIVKIQENLIGIFYETDNPWRIKYILVELPYIIDSLNIDLIFPANLDSIDIFNNELSWLLNNGVAHEGFFVYHGNNIDNINIIYSNDTTIELQTNDFELGSSYYWKVIAFHSSGGIVGNSNFYQYTIINNDLSISDEYDEEYILKTFPNPFNSKISLSFNLEENSIVSLMIYDLLGREIKHLTSRFYKTGKHKIIWGAKNNRGEQVSAGIYLCLCNINGNSSVSKILYLK